MNSAETKRGSSCSSSGFLDRKGNCRNPDGCSCDRIEALEAWKAEAMEVLLDAAAHLAAASSAYDKFAARHKDLKPRAVADPMFTTRNSDFIKAASRVSSAARRLVEKEDGCDG